MKKAISIPAWLLFVLTTLFPAGAFMSACFGYTFQPISISGFASMLAVLPVCVVVLERCFQSTIEGTVIRYLFSIITPVSLINAALCIFACSRIWVITCVGISAGCCCFLAIKHGKPGTLKKGALILSALMVLPISFFSFIAMAFGEVGLNTVVQTVESPDGKYYAQVVDSDQGALGGNTFVDVYEKGEVNAILFKIEKRPQRVFLGEWGIFENMEIYWKDDACLVINRVEYEIE